jgi:ribonuclease HI
MIHIYTDGSASRIGVTCYGGWAALLIDDDDNALMLGQGVRDTTNNRMELTAIAEGLEAMIRSELVRVFSDSQYCVRSINEWINGWRKRGWAKADGGRVKNIDLMERLFEQKTRLTVDAKWIKGHNGHRYNEAVDEWAVFMRYAAGDAGDTLDTETIRGPLDYVLGEVDYQITTHEIHRG